MLPTLTDLVENWTDRILEGVRGIIIETMKTQQFFKNTIITYREKSQ